MKKLLFALLCVLGLSVSVAQAQITMSALTSGGDDTGGGIFATASISPTANRLVTIAISGRTTTAASAACPTSVSGGPLGLTFAAWVSIANTTSGNILCLYRAMSASPGTGAISIVYANNTAENRWSVFEFGGVVTTGSNGADAVNSNTATNSDITGTVSDVTATLGAFGNANNGAVSATLWYNLGSQPTASPGTGWTEIHDQGSSGGGTAWAQQTEYRASNDTTADGPWSGNGAVWRVAAEIVAAGGGAATPAKTLLLLGVGW